MNDVVLYVLNSLAWSSVGFAAGWSYARQVRRERAEHKHDSDT